ncbi:MAG: chemotaxis protein CheW [Trichlorobacter sp.]|jgi:purine-binding chemotaxis protein CheW|nr:chemotaxis protein CheW [Trichlorobacter sp.]
MTAKSEKIVEIIKKTQGLKDVVDVDQETVKVVIFRLSKNCFAFYGKDVKEIIGQYQLSWVPGLPGYLPGLLNIRGEIESAISLQYLLEGAEAASGGMVVMVANEKFRTGVIVDEVCDVTDIPFQSIVLPLTTLQGMTNELVSHGFNHKGEQVLLLDLEKLESKVRL